MLFRSWPTPLGYYVYGVAEVDREAARQLATEFIDHTRSRAEAGAPGATAGNYGISLSWGVAGVHSSSAKYILDLDGNFATTGDQTTFTMDQTKDATGATVGDGSWSGFKSIGTFALTANSKIMVTNNAAGSYLTLDEFLLAPQDTVAVPEPSTLFLLGVGGLVAYRMIRNRRR